MAVFVPPGFFDFIMSLNDDDAEQIMSARAVMNGRLPAQGRRTKVALPGRPSKKKKQTRKVSAYQKRFGINLKKLKKAHPRTDISVLMKKAHRMTRRDMK